MAKKDEQTLDLTDVQAQIAAMLNEAKAEAARILEEARKVAGDIHVDDAGKAAKKAALVENKARMDELVDVKLFKDNGKYKDPVFVGVNGENVVIERGVRVKVKRKFAEVLEASDKQDYQTSKMIEAKSDEFARSGL